MTHSVILTASAEHDLLDLHLFVELHDSPAQADALLTKIEQKILSLDQMPQRGHHPPELARLGIHDFREIHCKPYRIIYDIMATDVMIHAVIDGRRDIRDLLAARLLR